MQCISNQFGVVHERTNDAARQTECLACPYGSGHNGFGQTLAGCMCSPGFEVILDGGTFSCAPCAQGMFKAKRSTEAHFVDEFLIPVSREADNQCQPCAAGTYQDKNGASECKVCPVGFYCPEKSVRAQA